MARKMALVPADFARNLAHANVNNNNNATSMHTPMGPTLNQLSSLDQEMKAVLENNTIDPIMKLQKYYYALKRYDTIQDNAEPPAVPVKIPKEKTSQPGTTRDLPVNEIDIVESLPVSLRNKGKLLLKYVRDNRDISWKPETKELVYRGTVVPGSNVFDLISDATRNRKTQATPTGWKQLASALIDQNVPRTAIGNDRRWEYIVNAHKARSDNVGLDNPEEVAGPSTSSSFVTPRDQTIAADSEDESGRWGYGSTIRKRTLRKNYEKNKKKTKRRSNVLVSPPPYHDSDDSSSPPPRLPRKKRVDNRLLSRWESFT